MTSDESITQSAATRVREPAGQSAHVRQGLHSCMTRPALTEMRGRGHAPLGEASPARRQQQTMREMGVGCHRRFRAAVHPSTGCHRRFRAAVHPEPIGGRSDVLGRQIAHCGRGPDVLGRLATRRDLVSSMSECHNLQSGGPEAWHSGFYARSVCSHLRSRIRPPCCFFDTKTENRESISQAHS